MTRRTAAGLGFCRKLMLLACLLAGCSGCDRTTQPTTPARSTGGPAANSAAHDAGAAAAGAANAGVKDAGGKSGGATIVAATIGAAAAPAANPLRHADDHGAAGAQAVGDVPERPACYRGNKLWNRNPLTPTDNPAYKNPGKRIDVLGKSGYGLIFVDRPSMVDWPKPKVALVLTGPLQGYIEPCGCAGLENMKGGLARRQTFLDMLSKEGWPLVKLDLGELARRSGKQSVIKFQNTLDGLRAMRYDAVGLAGADLRLPATDIVAAVQTNSPTQFVSANLGLLGEFNGDYCKSYRVIKAGGMKIGVTSVAAGGKNRPQNADVEFDEPVKALNKVVPLLKKESCNLLVLLANMSIKEAMELAEKFPEFDYVAAHDDNDPPKMTLIDVKGAATQIVELSHKGMWAGVIGIYDNPEKKNSIRYQAVPLDVRFADAPPMKQLMTTYQDQLREDGFDKLEVRPMANNGSAKFVSSQACAECHTKAFEIWKKTPHAHATETLTKLKPPRQFDPECLSCHVTGWNASEYRPYVSGYESLAKTPHLTANGCENCHGPGSEHVAAENGQGDAAHRKDLEAQMRVSLDEARGDKVQQGARTCARCHDLDNSPDFISKGFDAYWKQVEHHGKD